MMHLKVFFYEAPCSSITSQIISFTYPPTSQQRGPLPTYTVTMRSLLVLIWILILASAFFPYNSDAQNLVFTSGYSQMEHSFILDLEAGSLSEAGQQEVEPNLTFMDVSGKKS